MSLNPAGMGTRSWNFSRPNDDDYSLELYGTVVSLQEVQARDFNPQTRQPGRPKFWPDGNPVMNIRMGLALPDGSLRTVTFGKAGRKQASGEKPSLHMQLFNLAGKNMMALLGKTIHLTTWPVNPETNQPWGQGNPRLFAVEEVVDVKYELSVPLPDELTVPELLCNDAVHGGQPVGVAPQQVTVPQVPPMQGQFYAPPQPVMYQQPVPQPMYAQPAPMPTQVMPQQMSAPMPTGMDPAVAAAMQAVGAVNVQPVDEIGGVYDDIPFD